MTSPSKRLLLVHAHPDDETIGTGATMARYAAEGIGVTLLTCTLGEVGEILVPELVGLASFEADQLGGYRIGELERAMRALGVNDHRFLGGAGRWRDSGMIDTPDNAHPRAFWRCSVDEDAFAAAVEQAVAVIREVRPQVLVTYDERGGYGHPDHIMAHRVALAAADQAAGPDGVGAPWTIQKIYYSAVPKSVLRRGMQVLRESGQSMFRGIDDVDELPFGVEDSEITTAVNAEAFGDAKAAALRAHATQISVDGPFFALSNRIGNQVLGIEHYRLVSGELGPIRDEMGWETDLFDGVDA
ncbi:MAG: N-acetyl-1-D-myo-inositol-2-amino-2-deoxy-alpha-D-glucopyranoside deacetylase [Actinobacteria bacterium]|nr:N-acetyl-1-D-myo-inositol-2-amino-2-deoxy-alpha-D-glucopyranoside deacetylase [Actinomycetota bacterium]